MPTAQLVGWLALTSNSRLAGYLPEPVVRQLWTDGTSVLAGPLNPVGTAVAVPGGYRVTGQWSYASGTNHSSCCLALVLCSMVTSRG